jgi:hypothetical protein
MSTVIVSVGNASSSDQDQLCVCPVSVAMVKTSPLWIYVGWTGGKHREVFGQLLARW